MVDTPEEFDDLVAEFEDDWEDAEGDLQGEMDVEVVEAGEMDVEVVEATDASGSGKKPHDRRSRASLEKKTATRKYYTYKLELEGMVVGEVALPTNADWKDFLKAAQAKLGFQFECVRYDDDQEEDLDIECGDQTAWEQIGEMMEEETEFYKGVITLRVETKLSASAPLSPTEEALPPPAVKEEDTLPPQIEEVARRRRELLPLIEEVAREPSPLIEEVERRRREATEKTSRREQRLRKRADATETEHSAELDAGMLDRAAAQIH